MSLIAMGLAAHTPLTNITIYRLTPMNYTGVTNMDTGDAAGDTMFGMNQLTLPQLCPSTPDFTWCANRQYLSGGGAKMVYTEFVVEAEARFGQYNACNPDNETGIFSCISRQNGTGVPPQCATGFSLESQDCLNGTVLHRVLIHGNLSQAEGGCCEACTAAGAACGGWNLMPGELDPASWSCEVLKNDQALVEWEDAAVRVGCRAAYTDSDAHACWYTDPTYNITFADVCDRAKCACDAIMTESVGREEHAMCWNQSSAVQHQQLDSSDYDSRWFRYVEGLACLLDGTWYSTRAEGECKGTAVGDGCWWRLAATHRTVNSTCVDDRVIEAVRSERPGCWGGCPQPHNRTTACWLDCLFETMLGNASAGVPAMDRNQLVSPFLAAFLPPEQGGCPDI
eukprot:TRINITY_DN50042_c0_g1_i1.p1 TRINITY_DN50042_c0_g1~~TRINITY_DN50042_c0_g1_i1.p1  ORF type:complete len:396 (-),score=75.78 TRINITY_DN50042_c0_g1_i1:425-1612(-)